MEYTIALNKAVCAHIPVINNQTGEISYFVSGRLNNPNHTLLLLDHNYHEVGRLFLERARLFCIYTIDVINHSLVHVIKANTELANLFYITKLNYWVDGSVKKGSYSFRAGAKQVASVNTVIDENGFSLICNIDRPEDVPFILLISILFTQWHATPLKLPHILPKPKGWSAI